MYTNLEKPKFLIFFFFGDVLFQVAFLCRVGPCLLGICFRRVCRQCSLFRLLGAAAAADVCVLFPVSLRRGKKNSIILRTQLSVRVHACIGEWRQRPACVLSASSDHV